MERQSLIDILQTTSKNKTPYLRLSDKEIDLLPDEVGALRHLEELNLRANNLKTLPKTLGCLTNLQHLHLRGNQLSPVPPVVFELESLVHLNLRGNGLSELPDALGNLTRLERLVLTENHLSELPSMIKNLSRLTHLSIGRNDLRSIPPELDELKNLTYLDLRRNHLTSLPATIGKLQGLKFLDLSSNKLRVLPNSLGDLEGLEELVLTDNPLLHPPPEVVAKGLDHIRLFLKESRREKHYHAQLKTPRPIRTAIKQYLVYFNDFFEATRGRVIDFEVINEDFGLKLLLARTEKRSEIESALGRFLARTINNDLNLSSHDLSNLDEVQSELKAQIGHLQRRLQHCDFALEKNSAEIALKDLISLEIHPLEIKFSE